MARITKKQINRQIEDQKVIWGYERFHIEHRYNYYAIDEMRPERPAINPHEKKTYMIQDHKRTYKVGLTLKQAFELIEALIYGADTMKGNKK